MYSPEGPDEFIEEGLLFLQRRGLKFEHALQAGFQKHGELDDAARAVSIAGLAHLRLANRDVSCRDIREPWSGPEKRTIGAYGLLPGLEELGRRRPVDDNEGAPRPAP